jgi:hypothetical protein
MRLGTRARGNGRWMVAVMAAALSFAALASAQDRADYLIRLLKTSDTFRVRTQAALSLGRLDAEDRVVKALAGALRDPHPGVRSAAASSLERLGDPSALPSLRAARKDGNGTVRNAVVRAIKHLERIARTRPRSAPLPDDDGPSGSARFYVAVGTAKSNAGSLSPSVLSGAREAVVRQLRGMDGIVVAPDNEPPVRVQRTLSQRKLLGYHVQPAVMKLEDTPQGTRAVVQVILSTHPGRDMRAMLKGAATASGGAAERQAIEGAVTGALRKLPQALQASAARDGG